MAMFYFLSVVLITQHHVRVRLLAALKTTSETVDAN